MTDRISLLGLGFKSVVFCFIYFGLCWILVAACGLSLVAVSGGYSVVVLHRLLIAVASLVVEHGL